MLRSMYTEKMVLTRFLKKSTITLRPIEQQYKLYSQQHHTSKSISHPNFLGGLRFCSDNPPKCWNCHYVYKSELFCSKCKTLQELPDNLSYFDIIGIKKDYDVTNEEIHTKYRELQNRLHPDRFGNKSERERQISENLSSLINKAYSTLTHPLKRGLYMLRLEGISIPEETTSLNPKFLMEIMERNEEIENAMEDRDKLLKLDKQSREILVTLSKQVSEAFLKGDLDMAKQNLIKMKYYYSIDNRIKKLKHDIGLVE